MSRIKRAYFDEINAQPEPNEPYNEEMEMAMMVEYQEILKNDPDYEVWIDEKPF